jgi:predicted esterase YcpF (UPF0227 family)
VLRERLAALGRSDALIVPELPHSPKLAARMLEDIARNHPRCTLIGSSLGGYYATSLAERFDLSAVLVNPAVRPYEHLYLVGPQQNLYTEERYEFTAQHLEELRALEVDAVMGSRYLLILGTADEVLDYRLALDRYRGAKTIMVEGGDHGLPEFSGYIDEVIAFRAAPH